MKSEVRPSVRLSSAVRPSVVIRGLCAISSPDEDLDGAANANSF